MEPSRDDEQILEQTRQWAEQVIAKLTRQQQELRELGGVNACVTNEGCDAIDTAIRGLRSFVDHIETGRRGTSLPDDER